MKKILLIFSFSCIFLNFLNAQRSIITENEIIWDTWGIPHIYAKSNYDLYKMAGWAQMRNHGNMILQMYGEARGKSAEYWGTGFEQDRLLHSLGFIFNSNNCFTQLSADVKEILVAFADGINAYAQKYPNEIDDKYEIVLPVSPLDIIAFVNKAQYFDMRIRPVLGKNKNWKPGSNAWLVGPSKTKNGNAMLLASPHVAWSNVTTMFEIHFITGDNNLYGATFVGMPTIAFGFNNYLGWTHTNNFQDNVDLYEISMKDNKYLLDGEYHNFETDSILLKIKENDKIVSKPVIIKKSVHGIIIKESGNKALAIRFSNMDGTKSIFNQWYHMGNAKILSEFEEALSINSNSVLNTFYADKKGNIMYHFGGEVPKKIGDWEKWQKPVYGDSSLYIWTEYYDYNKLPHILNPKNGWIQNANDAPYTNTIPQELDPLKYPSHIISSNFMAFRPQRSANLLKDTKDLTFDSFIELQNDNKSELALRLKDDFLSLKSLTKDSLTLAAIDVITNWDDTFNPESSGAILFLNFFLNYGIGNNNLLKFEMFKKQWSYTDPLNTPDGFSDTEKVLNVLKKTAEQQLILYKKLDVKYGDVFRIKSGNFEFPANGCYGDLGVFRDLAFQKGNDGKFYAVNGVSFICAMEFGETVQAKALLTHGNASQPNNKHVGDQLKLFNEKRLREVWYSNDQIQNHIEMREKINDF